MTGPKDRRPTSQPTRESRTPFTKVAGRRGSRRAARAPTDDGGNLHPEI